MAYAPMDSCCFTHKLGGVTPELHSQMLRFGGIPGGLFVPILCMVARHCLVFQPDFWEAAECYSHGPPRSGASCKPSCCTFGSRMHLRRSTSLCNPAPGNEVWTPPAQGGNFRWPCAALTPHSPLRCQHMGLTGYKIGKQLHGDLSHSSHARTHGLNMKNDQNKRLSCNHRMSLARNHADGSMGPSTARRSH